jgi:VCBS repeat-containing protein
MVGVAPNLVTSIQFLFTTKPVPIGGVDIAGLHGTLNINPDGSYTYTRVNLYDTGAPDDGDIDIFTYKVTD